MKRHILIVIITALVFGCGSKTNNKDKDSITTEKKNFLEGLTVLEPQDYDLVYKLNPLLGGNSVPFYTEDGELIASLSERMNVLGSGNYNTSIYVNEKKEIKLWVVRLMTEEEKKKSTTPNTIPNVKSPLIDKDAIPFLAKDISGNEYFLKNKMDQKGKVIVMNFWFLGCYPCVKEIPELNKLVEKYKGKDVVFLGFARDKKDKLDQYLKKTSFNYTIIPESQSICDSYEVKTYPTHIVIDKNFKIKYYAVESVKPNEKSKLETEIDNALMN